ncbi:MAG: hypothetical protein AABZ71_02770, partial [Candidatus Binatota bacterium]
RGSGHRECERSNLICEEFSDGKVRSLWKRTQGRRAAILQRRVPWCLHEKIEARYTEIPRPNRRQTAAQAWTLKSHENVRSNRPAPATVWKSPDGTPLESVSVTEE